MPKIKTLRKGDGEKIMEGTVPLATVNQLAGIRKAEGTHKSSTNYEIGVKEVKVEEGQGVKKENATAVNETNPSADAEVGSKKENASEPAAKRAAPAAFQFKITLSGIEPLIWRRIQVPKGFTFAELGTTIREAMGWKGGHNHCFRIYDPRKKNTVTIAPFIFDDGLGSLDESKEKLLKYFPKKTNVAEYEYDFGDSWIHEILFEGEVPRKTNGLYPQCLGGERACPPEDCGGVPGYENLCKILKNPKHPEYANMKSWLKDVMGIKRFSPDKFDPNKVKFSLVKPQFMWVYCPPKFKF